LNLLEVDNLSKTFYLGDGRQIAAVQNVKFEIGRGETLGLVGESGSGKTTVGRCLLRLTEPDVGSIVFDGEDATMWNDKQLRLARRRMQMVFQNPAESLNPMLRIGATFRESLLVLGNIGRADRTDRMEAALASVGLDAWLLDRVPGELTASEQQRVGIARALLTSPDLVVLDEPTSSLDPSARAAFLELVVEVQQQHGISYLCISHDLHAVSAISHRIAIMYLGRIVETGPTSQIVAQQVHPYSRALMSAVLHPDPFEPLGGFTLKGEIPTLTERRNECPLVGRCPVAVERCGLGEPVLQHVTADREAACFRAEEIIVDTGTWQDPTTSASGSPRAL